MKSIAMAGSGGHCPKCKAKMMRREHPPGWTPKKGQPYFFKFWDVCRRCRYVQHFESAKVYVGVKA